MVPLVEKKLSSLAVALSLTDLLIPHFHVSSFLKSKRLLPHTDGGKDSVTCCPYLSVPQTARLGRWARTEPLKVTLHPLWTPFGSSNGSSWSMDAHLLESHAPPFVDNTLHFRQAS